MISSISQADRSNSLYATYRVTPVARIRSHAESSSSSLALSVRTAEGDTVELSFDATASKQRESGRVRSPQGQASYSRASQSDSFNCTAKVSGDLNAQELADIGSLVQSLQSGKPPTSSLSSLDACFGSFKQTTSVTDSTLLLDA
jgi:hypothetical protein